MEDLKISIIGSLDKELTVSEINKTINKIENESKLNKLDLKVKIDDSELTKLRSNANVNLDINLEAFNKKIKDAKSTLSSMEKERQKYLDTEKKIYNQIEKENSLLVKLKQSGARFPRNNDAEQVDYRNFKEAIKDTDSRYLRNYLKPAKSNAPTIDSILGEIGARNMDEVYDAIAKGRQKFNESFADQKVLSHLDKEIEKQRELTNQLSNIEKSGNIFAKTQLLMIDGIEKSNKSIQEQVKLIEQLSKNMSKMTIKVPTQPQSLQQNITPETLGDNNKNVSRVLSDNLNKAYVTHPFMDDNDFKRIFANIEKLEKDGKNATIEFAKGIEKDIEQFLKLENRIDDVIVKTQKLKSENSKKFVSDVDGKGNYKYEDIQQRVNEIKKLATDISQVSVQTGKNLNEVLKTNIQYTDNLGRRVTEVYKLVDSDNKIATSDGNTQTIKEWQLVEQKINDNIKQRNKLLEQEKKAREKINQQIEKQKQTLSTKIEDARIKGNVAPNDFMIMMGDFNKANQTNTLKSLNDFAEKYNTTLNNLTPTQVKFNNEQKKAREELINLARTGKYTTEELRKLGQGINFSTNLKQIEQLNNRINNLKFGTSIEQQQEKLISGFKRLFDQGKIGQVTFDKFNNAIKSTKNIQELNKLQEKLNLVTNSANNKNFQQKLISDAQTQLRTHAKTIDVHGVNQLIESIKRISPNSQNASNQLKQLQSQLKGFSNNAKEAARSSMTFGEMLGTAMEKFPVEEFMQE